MAAVGGQRVREQVGGRWRGFGPGGATGVVQWAPGFPKGWKCAGGRVQHPSDASEGRGHPGVENHMALSLISHEAWDRAVCSLSMSQFTYL